MLGNSWLTERLIFYPLDILQDLSILLLESGVQAWANARLQPLEALHRDVEGRQRLDSAQELLARRAALSLDSPVAPRSWSCPASSVRGQRWRLGTPDTYRTVRGAVHVIMSTA